MDRSQLELLVHYQDIDLMLQEAAEVERTFGFPTEGIDKIKEALDELAKNIEPRFLASYKRLSARYKRPISPVQDNTCLGCFAKLPTSYQGRGRDDKTIFTCENCGRILFWID